MVKCLDKHQRRGQVFSSKNDCIVGQMLYNILRS